MGKHIQVKKKKTAVLLAIFLSFWTWLYTYDKDKAKFWISMPLSILFCWTLIVPIGFWIWAIIDVSIKESEYYDKY